MTETKTPAPAGIEGWLSKLFGGPETKADKSLDKVKMAVQADLEKLKGSTGTAALLFESAENGFKNDLDELGISGEEQAPHLAAFKAEWDKMEMGKRAKEILDSSELSAMDGFITTIGNLPKLKEAIESSEPQSALESLLGGITGKVPGLSEFLKSGGLDSILTALGLDFLVSKKKEEPAAEKPLRGFVKKDEAKQEGDKAEEEAGKEAVKVPETFKPGRTAVVSDSNLNGFRNSPQAKARLNITEADMISQDGMDSKWGLEAIKGKDFKDVENVIIGFGTNDLTKSASAEAVWTNLQKMAEEIKKKNPKIKIFIATIPPAKGSKKGQWAADFTSAEKNRKDLNGMIRLARENKKIDGVIDLAASVKEGGLASDTDPESLATEYRRTPDDAIHASADSLANSVLRAEYSESKESNA